MDAEELKNRTKEFALRIIKLVAAFRKVLKDALSQINWCEAVLPLPLIIGPLVVRVHGQSLFPSLVLCLKKPMKRSSGLN